MVWCSEVWCGVAQRSVVWRGVVEGMLMDEDVKKCSDNDLVEPFHLITTAPSALERA